MSITSASSRASSTLSTSPSTAASSAASSTFSSSLPSPSLPIGTLPSGGRSRSSSVRDVYPSASQHRSSALSPLCAYPSWPSGSVFKRSSLSTTCSAAAVGAGRPSAYVSDEDLFGTDDCSQTYLSEAPAPPRSAEKWLARQAQMPPVGPPPQQQPAVPYIKPTPCRVDMGKKRRSSREDERKA